MFLDGTGSDDEQGSSLNIPPWMQEDKITAEAPKSNNKKSTGSKSGNGASSSVPPASSSSIATSNSSETAQYPAVSYCLSFNFYYFIFWLNMRVATGSSLSTEWIQSSARRRLYDVTIYQPSNYVFKWLSIILSCPSSSTWIYGTRSCSYFERLIIQCSTHWHFKWIIPSCTFV